jgi:hypothetical protein
LICVGLSLAGFLASTLARGTIQAMAAAPAVVIAMLLVNKMLSGRWPVWLTGTLIPYVFWPSVAVVLWWCAWRNFRYATTAWRFWRRNLLAFAGAVVFALATAGLVHHRLWEFLTPLEAAHGPARLPVAGVFGLKPRGYVNEALTLVLPDGKVWANQFLYEYNIDPEGVPRFVGVGKWIGGRGNRFINGSNWVDVLDTGRDFVGIRTNGTLWVSETPTTPRNWRDEPAKLVRYGDESNWMSLAHGVASPVALLKQDGTLWQWTGAASVPGERAKPWPGLRAFAPRRLGTDSDWSRVLYNRGWLIGWKNDGTAWMMSESVFKLPERAVKIETNVAMERLTVFDNVKLRSLTQIWSSLAGVREDGTLWIWNYLPRQETPYNFAPQQVGTEADWRMVSGSYTSLTALKADGSLWQYPLLPAQDYPAASGPPFVLGNRVQLGSQRDWVAVDEAYGPYGNGARALAADGSLWFWAERNRYNKNYGYAPTALAPSRKPELIGNIFAETKLGGAH